MSAIVGYFCRDGRPAAQAELSGMVEALAHRGADGSGMWIKGSVGLGHQMLWVTPESVGSHQPLVSRDGELAISADARIDNREELIDLLGWGARPAGEITDSALILGAYEAWGERCPEYLLGAFSFAIWDGRRQQLFCTRDHLGARPFYYYCSEGTLCFASEIKGIFALSGVPRRLNEVRIGYHLRPDLLFGDKTITFYQDVLRLAPAHTLTVGCERVELRCYWSLDIDRELRLGSDAEYAEAFRDLFVEAVRCRLRSAYPVGSMLSGGLDSSSIACTARDLMQGSGKGLLHTFSAVFDEFTGADESEYGQAVTARGGMAPQFTHPDLQSPFVDLESVFDCLDEGFWWPNYSLFLGIYRAASASGVRVLLDGTDGDTTVSHGFDYLFKLVRIGDWETFAGEARGITARFDDSTFATTMGFLWSYGVPQLTELVRTGQWGEFGRGVNRLGREFGTSRRRLLFGSLVAAVPERVKRTWGRLRGGNDREALGISYIHPAFAHRIDLVDRLDALESTRSAVPWTERTDHFWGLESGALPYSLELMGTLAGGMGIETGYPFCDRRLIEFCLSLPPEQKLRDGWSRWVMRGAMEGILPPKVQWRGGKGTLSPHCSRGLKRYERALLDEVILDGDSGLEAYVEMDALRSAYERYLEQGTTQDLAPVWVSATLALWLKRMDWHN